MTATTVAAYSYLRPSGSFPSPGPAGPRRLGGFALQTSGGPDAHPRFFDGSVTAPAATAAGLLAITAVALTRYDRTVTVGSCLDPVVTAGGDRLRFESFSGCTGVYARLDVLPSGLRGETFQAGTTNIDINPPLQLALTRVRGDDPMQLCVGPDEVTVTTPDGPQVERKVPLPTRWLRGFAEAQVATSGFDLRAELGRAEVPALLSRLPRGRSALWLVPAGRTLRATAGPVPGALCLSGADRLDALRPFLRHATGLRVYGPVVEAGQGPTASTWELSTAHVRLSLTLSPERERGFSGEGERLARLLSEHAVEDGERLGLLLGASPQIDVDDLSRAADLPPERVRSGLAVLASAGRVGYDVAEAGYYHRDLPFAASAVARLNPRRAGAQALIDAGSVTLDGDRASVRGSLLVHQVRVRGDKITCNCEWWQRHQGQRGPCKHALAVQILRQARGAGVGSLNR